MKQIDPHNVGETAIPEPDKSLLGKPKASGPPRFVVGTGVAISEVQHVGPGDKPEIEETELRFLRE